MKITLKNLHKATAQQVFDQVAKHLLKQGKRSILEDARTCLYRSEDGLMCAAGCLIADDEYDGPKMERSNWHVLVEEGIVPDAFADLIADLQFIHDDYVPHDWRMRLEELAIKRRLKMPKMP